MPRRQALLVGAAIAVVLSAGATFAVSLIEPGQRAGGSPSPAGASDPAHSIGADVRTVLVSRSMPAPSEPGLLLRAQLRKGSIPQGEVSAEVLADEECAPDATGLSRCRNVLRLADGRTIVVRHPHDMQQVACLTPGEHVLVRSATS